MSSTAFPRSENQIPKGRLLSAVVPVYNEEEVIGELHRRLSSVLETIPLDWEIVYVNDGSRDRTVEILREFKEKDDRIAIVDLSRNFGKETAMSAGFDFAKGDVVVVIDADLQDPPELISEFIKYWMEGYDVVYAKRTSREGETFFKKATAHVFYRFISKISEVPIPEDTGDYRLLSRRAVDSLKSLRERHRFMKGLFAWIGYPQKEILYTRDARYAGQTKWNYFKLWNFALEGITSFTSVPLKLATYIGFVIALVSLLYAVIVVYRTLMYGNPVLGYPSLIVIILFLGGVQLISLGLIGEYLARIFDESKQRPLYLTKNYWASRHELETKEKKN